MSFPWNGSVQSPHIPSHPGSSRGLCVLSQTAACGEQSRPLGAVQGAGSEPQRPLGRPPYSQLSLVTGLEILATRSEQEISLTRAFTCLQTMLCATLQSRPQCSQDPATASSSQLFHKRLLNQTLP